MDCTRIERKELLLLAEYILNISRLMKNMITNVVCKKTLDKVPLVVRKICTKEYFKQFSLIFGNLCHQKKIKFFDYIDCSVPANFYIDDAMLTQVIMNLLSNSLKFTSKGQIQLTVNVSSSHPVSISSIGNCFSFQEEQEEEDNQQKRTESDLLYIECHEGLRVCNSAKIVRSLSPNTKIFSDKEKEVEIGNNEE
jgi:K+-sensing histidine kinase KdpD